MQGPITSSALDQHATRFRSLGLILVSSMKALILKKIASHYGSPWTAKDEDYVVLNDGQVIGRITLHPRAFLAARGSGRSQHAA